MPESRRVRVTSSATAARAARGRPRAVELHEQSDVGEVYLAGLMRAQLRLSLTVLAVGAIVLGGLPLAFSLVPAISTTRIAGIGLPWWLLGVLVYPAAYLAARFYVRASTRIEQQFAEAVAEDSA